MTYLHKFVYRNRMTPAIVKSKVNLIITFLTLHLEEYLKNVKIHVNFAIFQRRIYSGERKFTNYTV